MCDCDGYKHLAPRYGSAYRQLFVKGTRIRALVAARALDPDPEENHFPTPEDVARDLNIPVEAVLESIRYCETNPVAIQADSRREDLYEEAAGYHHPDFFSDPKRYLRQVTMQDRDRIEKQVEREFGPR